jgi:photosystem II stability/assembly factor-like uncharacterized protein
MSLSMLPGRKYVAALVVAAGAAVLALSLGAYGSTAQVRNVPASFEPWAASFVSPSTGYVLGTFGCHFTPGGPNVPGCRDVVVRTTDAGRQWQRVGAPPVPLRNNPIDGGNGVDRIKFVNTEDGYLWGPDLWVTRDGGRHWSRIKDVGAKTKAGPITDVVASTKLAFAYALLAPHFDLFESRVGTEDWHAVASLPAGVFHAASNPLVLASVPEIGVAGGEGPLIAVYGSRVWVGIEHLTQVPTAAHPDREMKGYGTLWESTGRTSWRSLYMGCGSSQLPSSLPPGFNSALATSTDDLIVVCGTHKKDSMAIASSTDAGASFQVATLPSQLQTWIASAGITAAPGQTNTLLVSWPASWELLGSLHHHYKFRSTIERTTDGGRSWTVTSRYTDSLSGFGDIQFVSPTDDWVIHGAPGDAVDQLMRSTNAGATFTPVSF